jgi:hypothetical protein
MYDMNYATKNNYSTSIEIVIMQFYKDMSFYYFYILR